MNEMYPEKNPVEILLEDLPEKYQLLSFLINPDMNKVIAEEEISVQAGEKVKALYEALRPMYLSPDSASSMISLNKLCVRIVFLLYAEDALLFGDKGTEFHDYLSSFLPENRRGALISLFRILDTPEDKRDPYEDEKLLKFQYVNGGLFSEDIEIPRLPENITQIILEDMSEKFDWSKISPTIFGAVFESTLNPDNRREGGMHYTSVENIHKVIDPLFLDDLKREFKELLKVKPKTDPAINKWRKKLQSFQDKLASLTFTLAKSSAFIIVPLMLISPMTTKEL